MGARLVREGVSARSQEKRGVYVTADIPGVDLSFGLATEPVVGTRGHVLDHIGFEVKNLEALCKKLESEGVKINQPYRESSSAQHRDRLHLRFPSVSFAWS